MHLDCENKDPTCALFTMPWEARGPVGRMVTRVTASASMPSVTAFIA